MNWLMFVIVAYVTLALEAGLRPLLGIPQPGGVSPSLTLVLLTYLVMMAPPRTALWGALVLGLLVDLQQGPVAGVLIVGPVTLAYTVGALVMLQLRGMVFRESLLTLAVATFVVGIFVQLFIVVVYSIRAATFLSDGMMSDWVALDELVYRFQMLLYSAAAALPMGFILFKLTHLFGFPPRPRSDRYY